MQATDLVALAREIGVVLTEAAALRMEAHARFVLAANRTHALTAISDYDSALRLHVLDSLTAVQEVSSAPTGALLDLGSGAGFPGVPLAIATGRPTVLLESSRKKARVLEDLVRTIELPCVRVIWGRAEEIAQDSEHRDAYAAVVARAVAALASLVELAAPLLAEGGLFVGMKGKPAKEEIIAGTEAARMVGLSPSSGREIALPRGGESRVLLMYRRIGPSAVTLPRAVGRAQKRPLA